MNILVEYNFKKVFIVLAVIVFMVIAVWLCLIVTDYIRYKMEKIPIFAILKVSLIDYEDGHEERYKGLGYEYVETMRDSDTSNKFYVLGIRVK